MVIAVSSAVVTAELTALLGLIGSSGTLQFFDASSNMLGAFNLPNPAGVVFNNLLVFNGLPNAFTASSGAPVGAVPATMSVVSSSGYTLIGGISVASAGTGAVGASSIVNPGQTFGLISAQISSAVI